LSLLQPLLAGLTELEISNAFPRKEPDAWLRMGGSCVLDAPSYIIISRKVQWTLEHDHGDSLSARRIEDSAIITALLFVSSPHKDNLIG